MTMFVYEKEISTAKTEAMVCTANGIGKILSKDAISINEASGLYVGQSAKKRFLENKKPFFPGDMFLTVSGKLMHKGVKTVYHAVLQEYPNSLTSIYYVSQSLHKILDHATKTGVASIAIPFIGQNLSWIDTKQTAKTIITISREYSDLLEIQVVDMHKMFIVEASKLLF